MAERPGGDLRDALIYLEEIGFEELYLPELRQPAAGGRRTNGDRTPPAGRPSTEAQPAARTAPSTAPARPAEEPAAATDVDPAGPAAVPPEPAAPGSGAEERARELAALAERASGCESCRLFSGRTHVVFGSGDPDADLMFIGEGPGAEEDRRGLPFVGPAGELLTKIIEAIDLTRDRVYIANIVKCRPPGNRDPLPDEAAACRSYLERQIALVQPKVIVALGRVAAQALLGTDLPLGRMRGRWASVQGVSTMVTYHPAALLRNRAWKRPTWEDMQAVRDRLRDLS